MAVMAVMARIIDSNDSVLFTMVVYKSTPITNKVVVFLFKMNNSNEAFKIMNFCRKVAVMSQEDWIREYRSNLTGTEKRKLATIRCINSNPITCLFPWDPTTNTAVNPQERTPPMPNAVPPNLPLPENPDDEVAAEPPARNGRRRRDSDSDDDYQAPPQRRNAPQQAQEDSDSDSTDTALIVPSRRQQRKNQIGEYSKATSLVRPETQISETS